MHKMKSRINPNSFKGLLVLFLSTIALSLFSQSLPQIEARFANPSYNKETRTYYLDVELHSKTSAEQLFGMNLRFFYDASLLEFQRMDQFHQGYGILGNAPKPTVGTEQSGIQLFGFTNATAYINGGVQLLDDRFPLQITTDSWVKAFRVCFKVPAITLNKESFCPSVIWDVEAAKGQGGFLPGSAGLVITVVEKNRSTRFATAPTEVSAIQFNWVYDTEVGLPHGSKVSSDCIPLGPLVSTEEQDKTNAIGYSVFQNQPNPFESRTRIEFVLPYAQHATILLFDVDGVIRETIEGEYQGGKNQIELNQKPWMVETSVIYYRLQTEKYTSKTFSMSLVRA